MTEQQPQMLTIEIKKVFTAIKFEIQVNETISVSQLKHLCFNTMTSEFVLENQEQELELVQTGQYHFQGNSELAPAVPDSESSIADYWFNIQPFPSFYVRIKDFDYTPRPIQYILHTQSQIDEDNRIYREERAARQESEEAENRIYREERAARQRDGGSGIIQHECPVCYNQVEENINSERHFGCIHVFCDTCYDLMNRAVCPFRCTHLPIVPISNSENTMIALPPLPPNIRNQE